MSNMIDSRDISLVGKYHRPYHFNWFSVFAPVVPYVYDGSLSLLEMVQKLLFYINKVNKATNDNHTDIINLANEVQALAEQVAELPELIERIEALIAMLPPLYMVNITTDGEVATMDKTIDEIREIVAEGKIPMALVDESILAIYDAEGEFFQYNYGSSYTIIGEFTDNEGSVETTALIDENGGVISGLLTILNAPVNSTDAVNKEYVDNSIINAEPFEVIIDRTTFEEINTAYSNGKREFIGVNSNSAIRYSYVKVFTQTTGGNLVQMMFLNPLLPIYFSVSRGGWVQRKWIMDDYSSESRASNLPISSKFTIEELEKLNIAINEIEEAIENESLNVLITFDGEEYTSNHYSGDINEAFIANKNIKCKFNNNNYTLVISTNNAAIFSHTYRGAVSIISITENSASVETVFNITSNGSGINNTIITTLNLDYPIENDNQAVNKAYVDRLNTLNVIVESDGSSYTSNHYSADIYEAFAGNRSIKCSFNDVVYELTSCGENVCVFRSVNTPLLQTIIIRTDSVETSGNYVLTPNGTTINNTVTTTLDIAYEITRDEQAVNKKYVDEAIAGIEPHVKYVDYDLNSSPATASASYNDIVGWINEDKIVAARLSYNGTSYIGYACIDTGAGIRYCTRTEVGKNTLTLKHNADDTISTQEFLYITKNGGSIESGRLTIGSGARATYDRTPTGDTELINKRYVDNALADSVPTVYDVINNSGTYTLPETYATIGTRLYRNPYIAIRWNVGATHGEIMYLNAITTEGIIFSNINYRAVYNSSNVLTFTQL